MVADPPTKHTHEKSDFPRTDGQLLWVVNLRELFDP